MIHIDFLAQVYLISFLVGGIFIVFNLVIGQIGHLSHHGLPGSHGSHGLDGHHGISDHHGAGSHQGALDHHGVSDHSSGHSHADAAHHSTHSSSTHDMSNANSQTSHTWIGNFISASFIEKLRRRLLFFMQSEDIPSNIGMFLIAWLSPMRIALWLTFFGFSGFFIEHFLPLLSLLTLIPAILIAILSAKLFNNFICWTIDSLQSPTMHSQDDLIGTIAEVNLPMTDNQIGEIVYMVDSGRINCAAKPAKPGLVFKRGTKVMIVEIKNHIALVEPVTDPVLLEDK